MGPNGKIILATGIGSGIMYLLDPNTGRRRRALMRDKLTHARRKAGSIAGKTARDLGNRARGVAAETRSAVTRTQVPDEVLHEQVRSKLGRVVSHAGSIEVEVTNGRVRLTGPILADEVDMLLSELSSLRGIRELDDRLEVHEEPGSVPGLQGVGSPPPIRAWKRDTWPPGLRILAGTGGTFLLLSGAARRDSLARTLLGLSGAALLIRSAVNLPWKRITGIGAGRVAVDVRKSIFVDAPVEEVFDFWSNPENFPQFMSHVKEVQRTPEPNEFHWIVSGPAGAPVHWDAAITKLVPNEVVGWKTVSDSLVKNAGMVRFEPESSGTRVHVHLKYNPGLGALGHAAAKLFGADPKSLMDADLARMKTSIESRQREKSPGSWSSLEG